jgi:hypothetical protein
MDRRAEVLQPVPAPVYEWVMANRKTNNFAHSLCEYYTRTGTLTENQVRRVQERLPGAPATVAPPVAHPVSLAGEGFTKLLESFNRAKVNGLKHPKLTTGPLAFSLAPEHGKNPGFIYIKHHGEYAGKVSPEGIFSKAYETTPATVELITRVGRDPLAEAIRHGHETGNCAICSRRLSDLESVQRGIGPVCAKRFGW